MISQRYASMFKLSSEKVNSLWNKFLVGENHNEKHKITFKKIEEFFNSNDFFIYKSIKDYNEDTNIDESSKVKLKKIINNLRSDDLSVQFISQSVADNRIEFLNELTGELVQCTSSYSADGGFNNLFFGSGKSSFIIIQHVCCCDFVYFPHENLIVKVAHMLPVKAMLLIMKQFQAYVNGEFTFRKSSFGGVLVSQSRPYHFYYEVSLALRTIFLEKLLPKIPDFYQFKGHDFLGVDELYRLGSPEKDKIVSFSELNEISVADNKYFVHVGMVFNKKNHMRLRASCDAKIMHYVEHRAHLYVNDKSKLVDFKKAKIKLWIGVTGQKRAWVEQVEAQAELINRVCAQFDNVAVVFDGWTSPMSPGSVDTKEIKADEEIVSNIIKLLTPDIYVVSVVGCNTIQKLAFATECDFFVANQATGSLHICRFAKIKGVTHISNAFKDISMRQHYLDTAIPFPGDLITDLSVDGARHDYVSYSIQQDDFVDFVLPLVLACKQPA